MPTIARLPTRADPFARKGGLSPMAKRAAFAEGKLFDKDGTLCATATTTCLVFTKEKI